MNPTAIIVAIFVATIVGTVAFLAVEPPWRRHQDRVIAWHVWSFSAAYGVETLSLLLLALGVRISPWIFVAIFAGSATVVYWRLLLAVRGRHR